MKDSFHDELKHAFDKFCTYHVTVLLGDFNVKVCKEDIFKPTIGNESYGSCTFGQVKYTIMNLRQDKIIGVWHIFTSPMSVSAHLDNLASIREQMVADNMMYVISGMY
jgi:hypothetical protein